MASLSLKNICKVYPNGFEAVKDFNLEIADQEFIIFVGPSGCGKSTTLRMIAGLEEISSGELWIGDKLVNDVEPKDRDIAMVFQNYALYPHMTVYDNMAFGLKLRKVPKDGIDKMVKEVKNMDSIDWKNHVINSNDFKYSQIAEQLQGMQKVVIALTMIISGLGLVVLMLILTLRMRGRIQEAGILLAIGKSKQEIVGQFLLEALVLLLLGFWLSVIIFLPLADILNSFLFDSIAQTEIHKNYLQPDFLHFIALFLLESLGVFMTVLVCSGAILRLKPKEILTKMS